MGSDEARRARGSFGSGSPLSTDADKAPTAPGAEKKDSPYAQDLPKVPKVELPKGGGALKSIDEKFQVNAANGTASLKVPLPFSKTRSDFAPALALSYDSGSGNSPFGLGWSLGQPTLQRRTDKFLPTYQDADEGDVFTLSGAEDLVPTMVQDAHGNWALDEFTAPSGEQVKRYRPRIESDFSRIERITPKAGGPFYWRTTSRTNVVTLFGRSAAAQLADPSEPSRVFRWLPELSYDDKGNCLEYGYLSEDLTNAPNVASERNRLNGVAPFTNTYVKWVKYGNTAPYSPSADAPYNPPAPVDPGYLFQMVVDYGDHDPSVPTPTPQQPWPCRLDPFSRYKSGFEVRTYRLARRILFFHFFKELNDGVSAAPVLVRSLDAAYRYDGNPAATPDELRNVEVDYPLALTLTHYRKNGAAYDAASLPPLSLAYQELSWDKTVHEVSRDALEGAPTGLTTGYQWVDLWGEGISGILSEQGTGWFYKRNFGGGAFAPEVPVAPKPSFVGLGKSTLSLQDMDADGRMALVVHDLPLQGFFRVSEKNTWDPFRAFEKTTNADFADPNAKFIDLNGDGRADLIISEDAVFRWYPNEGHRGYAGPELAAKSHDEEKGPALVFSDSTDSIFLADMTGDGLTDIVRIRNGEVCYWPNLGFGRFGPKVTMNNAPVFDTEDLFNPAYLHLGDVSGSGATDLLYLGQDRFRAWLNQAGNGWTDVQELDPFPSTEQGNQLSVMDFLGEGTSCLVWSSDLPPYAPKPLRYVDLMGGRKPYLLSSYSNGVGKTVSLEYASSTSFYLADELAGTPWSTKLPFPVQCVAKVSTTESVTRAYLTSEYSYHHGYFDPAEREYRGFGRVEQTDSEVFDQFVQSGASNVVDEPLHQAPVLIKRWFHTGVFFEDATLFAKFQQEYFQSAHFTEALISEPSVPDGLTAVERRQAARAMKGMLMRQETYGLDGVPGVSTVPYSAEQHTCLIQRLQPQGLNRYAVFLSTESEVVSYAYERSDADPRIAHTLNTSIDPLGNILESAQVAYPRQAPPPGLPAAVTAEQARLRISYQLHGYTTDVLSASAYRLRVQSESTRYELTGVAPASAYFASGEIRGAFATAAAIAYEASPSGALEKRLLKHARNLFLKDDLSGALPLGQLGSLGLAYQSYHLAFTQTLLAVRYGGKVTPTLLAEGRFTLSQTLKTSGLFPTTDAGDEWWQPSGRALFPSSPASSFYLPDQFVDAWGNPTQVAYDAYFLQAFGVVDAVGNAQTVQSFDWRLQAPLKVQDANQNLTEVRFNLLGLVSGLAVEGKGSEADDLTGFVTDPLPADVAAFFADPVSNAAALLQNATRCYVYDFSVTPARVGTVVRETHAQAALASGTPSKLQLSFEYTDGFGHVAMKKVQAKPGIAKALDGSGNVIEVDTTPNLRWVGNGRTVLNNKGKPVMQYEPYFSVTPAYEDEPQLVEMGVTTVTRYDALGRAVRVDAPNGTYQTTENDAWQVVASDSNDNVLTSQWYADRTTGPLKTNPQEAQAAQKTQVHANTPAVQHADPMGRSFFRVDDNKWLDPTTHAVVEQFYGTQTLLDIEGNATGVIDPRGVAVMSWEYELVGGIAHVQSADGGERWFLSDARGNPIYRWDSKLQTFHSTYDALHRPVLQTVLESGAIQPLLHLKTVYGEGQPGDVTQNLRGQVYQRYDQAGVLTQTAFDWKGNLLASTFQYTADPTDDVDWSQSPTLSTEVFATQGTFDALSRPTRIQGPSVSAATANVAVPTFNESAQLQTMDVFLRGAATATRFVTNLDYDEKGQRQRVDYGNGTSTVYKYDPLTFRLLALVTARAADPELFWDDPTRVTQPAYANDVLQFLTYTYDPVGNITFVADAAQDTIYFNNAKVDPSADYTYDAIYRLVQALGREHIWQGKAPDPYDAFRMGSPQPGDGTQLQRYTQIYQYDASGNLQSMGNVGSWSRAFTYEAANNQMLTAPAVGDAPFTFTYDPHGCTRAMPHLPSMDWDFLDRLRHLTLSSSETTAQEAWYGYGAGGQRMRKIVKKGALTEERLYLGSFERFRQYSGTTLVSERETLHVVDDARRIALVDTPTQAAPGSQEKQLIRYQYANNLGTACLEVDDAAKVISYEEYYSFGSTSYQGTDQTREVPAKRYRYCGKERDEESGLSYHGARYYAPWLARWTQADPAGLAGGSNRFAYVKNNPIKLIDPDGRQEKPVNNDEVDKKKKEAKPAPKKEEPKPDAKADPFPEFNLPRLKLKFPQPPANNAGPTQTGFIPGDVGTYDGRPPVTLGSVGSEFNLFVLGSSSGDVTSYLQVAARWRTSKTTENGFIAQVGGVSGSPTAIGSFGYQFRQGTPLDSSDNAPALQKGQGNWFTLSLASTPHEKQNPAPPPGTPGVSDANLTANYTHAWSSARKDGASIDLNVGINAAVRGQVYGRDVWGYANPFFGFNVSRDVGHNTSLNFEFAAGPTIGGALVYSKAGDPSFPATLLHLAPGFGVQKQVGATGQSTIGVEVLGNVDALSTVHGPVPWGLGGALTASFY